MLFLGLGLGFGSARYAVLVFGRGIKSIEFQIFGFRRINDIMAGSGRHDNRISIADRVLVFVNYDLALTGVNAEKLINLLVHFGCIEYMYPPNLLIRALAMSYSKNKNFKSAMVNDVKDAIRKNFD